MNQSPITYGDAPDPPQVDSTVLAKLKALADEIGPEGLQEAATELQSQLDAMRRGNQVRQDAAHELESLEWEGAGGQRFPLLMTFGKFASYEWLRRMRRGADAPLEMTENETMASRYLDSSLLLFICATGRPPTNVDAALDAAEEWADRHIPVARRDEALGMANRLLDLIDLFRPVHRPTSDDEGEQKKTHNLEVKPGT